MDRHASHTNINFVEFCWNHKIIFICLPPHSTHFLQPLDLVIFLVLKHLYLAKIDEYAACGITGINRDYFLRILGEIQPNIYTPELIIAPLRRQGFFHLTLVGSFSALQKDLYLHSQLHLFQMNWWFYHHLYIQRLPKVTLIELSTAIQFVTQIPYLKQLMQLS